MEGQVLVRQSGERSRIRRHRATGNYDNQEKGVELQTEESQGYGGLVGALLRLYHDMPSTGHRGIEGTMEKRNSKYLVLGLREKVKTHIENCLLCEELRPSCGSEAPNYQYQVIPLPFHQVHMDILGITQTVFGICGSVVFVSIV